MPLSRRGRVVVGLSKFKAALHILPDARKAATMPLAKRLATGPPRWAIDRAPVGITSEDHRVPQGPRVRLYRPEAQAPVPVLLYLHGGGWTVGGLACTDHICQRLAADAGCAVLGVEYRLAPEYPYPAALDDAEAALSWLKNHAALLGIDETRLAVGGGSAGGNLAAALVQRAHLAGQAVQAQVLVYPALDGTRSTRSARRHDGPGLTPAGLEVCWELYSGGHPLDDPGISPLLAPHLKGLPPTLVVTAGRDPLRDEGLAYAERLAAADVPCQAVDYPDYMHGFLSVPRMYDDVDACWTLLASFLVERLGLRKATVSTNA